MANYAAVRWVPIAYDASFRISSMPVVEIFDAEAVEHGAVDPGTGLLSNTKVPPPGRRILIAEDESLIAFELETILEGFGYRVIGPVRRVEEVLRYTLEGRCDGALLDVNLRGQQIFEILPRLQALGLPFIIASGYQDVTLFPAPFRTLPRIAKPVDENELRQVCEHVFGNQLLVGGTGRLNV